VGEELKARTLRRDGALRPPAPCFALSAALLLFLTLLPGLAPNASAAVTYPPFQVQITGPAVLPSNGSGVFDAVASGGPAETLGGEFTGNYTFTSEILGVDTAGSFVSPQSGAFIGQDANLSLGGLVNTGIYTLEMNVTSHGIGNKNLTQIFSYQFSVVIPYIVTATVINENSYQVSTILVGIELDGVSVGRTEILTLAASASTQISFNFTGSLSAGYHTFTFVLEGAYGLLQFGNGQTSYSVQFYVSGPAVDYTQFYLIGGMLAVLAILISLMIFGPRRPRKKKSP
jgi:hypothetical protein